MVFKVFAARIILDYENHADIMESYLLFLKQYILKISINKIMRFINEIHKILLESESK
jgi:hypothetical protein